MKRLTQDVFNQFSASSSKGLGLSAVFSKGFAAASVMYGSYLLLFGKLFIDKYIYPKPRKQESSKIKQLKIKHEEKVKQLEEEFTLKLKQLRETQKMELKNAKNEIANMVEKEDKDKKKN